MRSLILCAVLFVTACGNKVPESEAAKRVGQAPKDTVNSFTNKTNELMQQGGQGSERLKEDQK
jgi:hypothetical protein